MSLFARPVPAEAILAVAGHDAFAGHLAGWTPATVQAAVQDRLGALVSWHPDGAVSAHPLVRDTFRPLVMAAAEAAADTALTGMPEGTVTSRADALRVVEAIELLLDAGQWQPAHDMYLSRTNNGQVWMTLPAARSGQRAAAAFVATPGRRNACATRLTPSHLGYYLNEVGRNAMHAGDLITAREYLLMAVRYDRDAGDMRNLSASSQNLAECLGHLGEIRAARTPRPKASAAQRAMATGRKFATLTVSWGGLRDSAATLPRPGTSSPPPTRYKLPTIRTVITCTHCSESSGRNGWPARGGRPGPGADGPQPKDLQGEWLERRRGTV